MSAGGVRADFRFFGAELSSRKQEDAPKPRFSKPGAEAS